MDSPSAIGFKVDVSRVPETGISVRMDASDDELAKLAEFHGVESVRNFHAEFRLTRWKLNGVRARGVVEADIVQRCVVTMDPIDARIREEVDTVFLPEGAEEFRPGQREGNELIIDFEGDDAPEIFAGSKIDLGALAEEFFELGIDPYPRKPGADVAGYSDEQDSAENRDSPFAALEKLKSGTRQQKN